MIRAKVRRDGPGEWSWTLQDDHSDLVTGIAGSWPAALGEVTDELRLLDEADQPPGCEIPIIRGPITPGDAMVPAGDRLYDHSRPVWKRWLGL